MLRKTQRGIAVMLLLVGPLAVGTTLNVGCLETFLSAVNPCGTVLANCEPADWYRWIVWPFVEYPDYERDPSCTIPYACGDWFGDAGTRGATGSSS